MRRLQVEGDSQLIVRQVMGQYQVKAPHLVPLCRQAVAAAGRFTACTFKQVPRAQNSGADALANAAMDSKGSFCVAPPATAFVRK